MDLTQSKICIPKRAQSESSSKVWLTETQRDALIEIIEQSFANVDAKAYIDKYFNHPRPYERKLRLYIDTSSSDEKIVGYCLLTFTDDGDCTLIKASAAFLPRYRKGGNTFLFSMQESAKAWCKRPWRKLFYADTMLSPAMYRAIAKNTAIIWPQAKQSALKPEITSLFERFNPEGQVSEQNQLRCLVAVDRKTNYQSQELAMLRSSSKTEIQYYCQVNPCFDKGIALFVIIPVGLKQFCQTLLKRLGR